VAKNLLIIFYRNPELGKVKTRLAATLGDANALAIYHKLIAHTRSITEKLPIDKFVFYSHFVDREDNWSNENYEKYLQQGVDLGAKLSAAVQSGFEKGYKSICVIGSDCLELSEQIIRDAFKSLDRNDAVIGPAKDGGYYLLGTNKFFPQLFQKKDWSTSSVFDQTLGDFKRMNISFKTLPTLTDVDYEYDLPDEIRNKLKGDK